MNVEKENRRKEEVPYDEIEYQADLAKLQVNASGASSAGFGLLLSSISALVAIVTLGQINDLGKWLQFSNLYAITIILIATGMIIIAWGSGHYRKKIDKSRDRLREAKKKELESKSTPNQSTSQ
ncbi:hypothetical protein NTE_01206 [Candidatus Nitrososphaera evergladensis SR1]|uniref:Uncharacterized protein n=1 Tax=Candidatus Nitrososphaera evergladensis SR1 TaxID=1459636 RepID=A0A075MQ26_9ARCH|nr:MFS transporter [Candidatus Nitrososphaera evergladensis]AIF83278.1 hypothetical protein NTE_01206 [Candidatus Nitrososphaera evergladensis SR1]